VFGVIKGALKCTQCVKEGQCNVSLMVLKKAVLAVWGRVGKAGDHLTPIYM